MTRGWVKQYFLGNLPVILLRVLSLKHNMRIGERAPKARSPEHYTGMLEQIMMRDNKQNRREETLQ